MKSYIIKPKSVRRSEVFNINSYSIRDFLVIKNIDNPLVLKDLLEKSFINSNIDSKFYFENTNHYLLTNKSISSNSLLLDDKTLTGITPEGYKTKKACPVKVGDILVGNNGSLGDCLIIKEQKNIITNSNLTLLRFKQEVNPYYILGLLFTKWFKDCCRVISSKSGTQEFITRSALESVKIPFPTTANHSNPEKVETFISLVIQNIIDKEEQIKLKNKQINELIEKELRENQKAGSFSYSYPKISDLKEETRLDTGIYEREFKKMSKLIENYSNGNYFLNEKKISPGVTPKDYYFSDYKRNKNFHDWVTPKNINQRQLAFHTYIFTKTKSKVQDNSLILNGIRYVGNGIFVEKGYSVYTNQNTLIINQFEEKFKQLFLLCFLTSDLGKKMQMIRRNFGIVPILYTEHLCKIPIPNFSESKQQSIAKLYYNPLEKNKVLDLENYLEKEQIRNRQVGIFQLNMEIFDLREQLEDLVHKIVMEEKIEIS